MKVRTYGTKEVAQRLAINEMTVRRWVQSGRLPGGKKGKNWEIDAAHVDRMVAAATKRARVLDFTRAARKVLNARSKTEWLPDGLRYRDVKWDSTRLLSAVQRRFDVGDLEGREIEHIAVPKGHHAFRPGAFLRLDDEVMYTALVMACGQQIESSLGDFVYSYRMAHEKDPLLLRHQGKAWGEFQRIQREASSRGWTHALVTDVAGYYEYIDEIALLETLGDAGVPAAITDAFLGLIKGWRKKTGLRGLPQGPDASAVLANAHLLPVDEQMAAEAQARGWEYVRWSDDIRVFTRSGDDARTAAYLLSLAMRRRGLYLAPAKTDIVSAAALATRVSDNELGQIAYLFDVKQFDKVKKAIGPVYRAATDGGKRLSVTSVTELRFCLYRMGRIRDDRALGLVLRELPNSGFLEFFVYLYLREFIDRPKTASRIIEVLEGLDPYRDALLAGNLLRVLAEAGPLPVRGLNVIRRYAWGMTAPDAVRAVAVRAIGRHATTSDEAELKIRLWREADRRVVRSMLAAIKDASPSKSNSTLGDYRRTNPEYTSVVDYLMRFGAPALRD